MKTVLPIPEQDGFRVSLPDSVRLAPNATVCLSETGISLSANGSTLQVALPDAARRPLMRALNEHPAGMSTVGLALSWRQMLERLAIGGYLVDASSEFAIVSPLTALATILGAIHEAEQQNFHVDHPLSRLIAGKYEPATVVTWLVENYHYTKSATAHIGPVLDHAMSDAERALWQRFYEDESWHWRIYRPAFEQFGLDYESLDASGPEAHTREFIQALRRAAEAGPVAYAAVMLFIEKPPQSTDVDEDPLFAGLMQHYGFSRRSIRPLWWHAVENLTAGHSALGAVVITNREQIVQRELDQALSAIGDVVAAVSGWHEKMLAAQ